MKLKLTLMAVAAVLSFGYQSQATPFLGTVTNSSRINVALTIGTNAYSENGNVQRQTVKTVKVDNKYLLNLFANWYDVENSNDPGTTVWPEGSHLVIGWDAEWTFNGHGDVLVVDKTGTNVLYDATSTSDRSTHYFQYYYYYFLDGAYSYLNSNPSEKPGFYQYTDYDEGEGDLYDNNFYLPRTTVEAYYTPYTTHFRENWDSTGNFTTWSESAEFDFTGSDLDFMGQQASVTGTIKDEGHGKGFNNTLGLF